MVDWVSCLDTIWLAITEYWHLFQQKVRKISSKQHCHVRRAISNFSVQASVLKLVTAKAFIDSYNGQFLARACGVPAVVIRAVDSWQ